jgi:Leucine-rich repeat (LRR) protein
MTSPIDALFSITDILYHIFRETSQEGSITLLNCRAVSPSWNSHCLALLDTMSNQIQKNTPRGLVDICSAMASMKGKMSGFVNQFKVFRGLANIFSDLGATISNRSLPPMSAIEFRTLQDEAKDVQDTALKTVWHERLSNLVLEKTPSEQVSHVPSPNADAEEIRNFLNDPTHRGVLEQITALNLKSLKLMAIPHEINHLHGLKSLYLNDNRLSRIPNFAHFPDLEVLSLFRNNLRDVPNFTHLPKLKSLYIQKNQLVEIPNFTHLPSLDDLLLHNNKLSQVPDFTHLPNLAHLSLYNNQLSEIPNFANIPKLKSLRINDNQLNRLPEFEHLPDLKLLEFRSNPFLSLPDPIQKRFPTNHAVQLYHCQYYYRCEYPLADLYQSFLKNVPLQERIIKFNSMLDDEDRNLILEMACGKAEQPGHDDPQWKEHLLFNDMTLFGCALHKAIMTKFERLTDAQQNQVCEAIGTEAGGYQPVDHRFAMEHVPRLADTLSKLSRESHLKRKLSDNRVDGPRNRRRKIQHITISSKNLHR